MNERQRRHRCFVGVQFQDPFLDQLEICQKRLSGELTQPLRFTRREQFHLTLMFLGDRTDAELQSISKGLRGIRHAPLALSCVGFDLFRPSVIYARIDGADSLAKRVADALAFADVNQGKDKFIGHATLARIKAKKMDESVRNRLRTLPLFYERSTADRFCLLNSKISHLGAEYSVLESFLLG